MTDRPPALLGSRTRFTAWLTERERFELERKSLELGLSLNQTLRIALRVGLGLPVSDGLAQSVRVDQEQHA